jgi:hypothetical protein
MRKSFAKATFINRLSRLLSVRIIAHAARERR